jgi:serine/threonine-protein kinase
MQADRLIGFMSAASRLAVLLFTDIVGSTDLKARIGTTTFATLLQEHNSLFESACAELHGEILKHTGDGYFAAFATGSEAVRAALRFQHEIRLRQWAEPVRVRIGIHVGEVAVVKMAGRPDIVGMAADLASRVMSLADGGQILLTRTAFNDARQFVSEHPRSTDQPPPALKWVAHGAYLFKGVDEPIEVFEVGAEGLAPLSAPIDVAKGRRVVPHDQEPTLGWRPAVGLTIPQRVGWLLEKRIGEGGFGEVWLARHEKTRQLRVFKFCFDAERLRSFKRELTLFRLIRDALGERDDIAKLFDVKLDEPPFFLESEWTQGGDLREWAQSRGGIDKVQLAERIALVAKVATAVAAAHSVGILHKDIKPSNVLVHVASDETAQPRLADFGIGFLADRSRLEELQITASGFTMITEASTSTGSATRLYSPPELLAGKPFTIQGDIYSLGVLLYQMVVGDLTRPLAEGWERDVGDELLREDIGACVEGDPQRRLSSAGELANRLQSLDERRFERQRALQLRLTMLRRKRLLRVSAISVAALVILSAVMLYGLIREKRLKLLAEREKEKSQAVTSFLTNLLKSSAPTQVRGKDFTVREALMQAEKDMHGRFADKPDVRLALHHTLGETYFELLLYSKAEYHLREALELVRGLHGRDSLEAVEILRLLAYTVNTRGLNVNRSEVLQYQEERYRILRLRLGEEHPDTVAARGDYEMVKGALDPEGDPEVLLEGLSRLTRGQRSVAEVKQRIEATLVTAAALLRSGNQAGAIREFRKEADFYLAAAPEIRSIIATGVSNLAWRQFKVKEYDQAEIAARAALQLAEEIHGPGHPFSALVQCHLARFLAGRPDATDAMLGEAEQRARTSMKICQELAGDEHPETQISRLVLADVLLKRKRPAEALEQASQAGEAAARGEEKRVVPWAKFIRAEALFDLGRRAEAVKAAREAERLLAELKDMEGIISPEEMAALLRRVGATTQSTSSTAPSTASR